MPDYNMMSTMKSLGGHSRHHALCAKRYGQVIDFTCHRGGPPA